MAEVVAVLHSWARRLGPPGSRGLHLSATPRQDGLTIGYGTSRFSAWTTELVFDLEGLCTWGTVTVSPPHPILGRAALTDYLNTLVTLVNAIDQGREEAALVALTGK